MPGVSDANSPPPTTTTHTTPNLKSQPQPRPVRRLYDWKAVPNSPIQDALARQPDYVRMEFENRLQQVR